MLQPSVLPMYKVCCVPSPRVHPTLAHSPVAAHVRHVKFNTQYFATEVVNCVVDSAEQLVFDAKTRRKKPARKATSAAAASGTPGVAPAGQEVYAPLRCRTCNTEVGVQDEDGAYHLFHVIPAEEH